MLNVVVVDDEFPAREVLKYMLRELGVVIAADFEDGVDVGGYLNSTHGIDAVFLDIKMRDLDGISTAREIMQLEHPPYIIFTTGFSEYAIKAFELNVTDYILKPYSKSRLLQTIKRIEKHKLMSEKETCLYNFLKTKEVFSSTKIGVWSGDRMFVLSPLDIIYVTSATDENTVIISDKGKFFTNLTLQSLEKQLGTVLLRTHKSYLVNIEKVVEVIPWFNHTYMLALEGIKGCDVPVARHYMKRFNEEFLNLKK